MQRAVHGGVAGGQCGVGIVPALVIVVLDIQVGQLRVLNPEGAACVINVLSVEGELGGLRRYHVWILN